MPADRKPVALVSMPTLSGRFPSFQLGLLKPTLERAGFPAQSFSLYMYFGAFCGWKLHEAVAEVWPSMVGEWIWAKAAFGEFAKDETYFERYRENFRTICDLGGCTLDDIRRVRDEVTSAFLAFCVERIDWSRFGLVGFTVLFQQQLASLALARELKKRWPDLPIILGGGTFEDDIAEEMLRSCPQVDYIHCGDADESFPAFVRSLYAGERVLGLPGIMARDPAAEGKIVFGGRAENLGDLNLTPVPDFDEYFYARAEGGYASYPRAEDPMIPIETARGCWWGMKAHCTFCGLNRAGMDFRAKDVENVLAMLEELSRKHGFLSFNAIDNIIAPSYVEKLFGALADARTDLAIHYEIKANLTREQLGRMRMGGLFSVQPGVESLSTNVLRIMRKGTTAVRNLELIKWCTYFGINNLYNILLGFPGETVEDYRQQGEIIAKIPHYQPPYALARARPDRGSPMFTAPEEHAITALRPEACYSWIFPTDRFDLRKVSYYFEHEQERVLTEAEYAPSYRIVARWRERWERQPRAFLRYEKAWDAITIADGRIEGGEVKRFRYEGAKARLYEFLEDAHGRDAIDRRFGAGDWIDAALEEFVAADLAVLLDGRYLALALPANQYHGMSVATKAKVAAEKVTEKAPADKALPRALPTV